MNIYRKVCLFFKFRQKKKSGIRNFTKKGNKILKAQVFTICLNQKRSNTYNQGIENEIVMHRF